MDGQVPILLKIGDKPTQLDRLNANPAGPPSDSRIKSICRGYGKGILVAASAIMIVGGAAVAILGTPWTCGGSAVIGWAMVGLGAAGLAVAGYPWLRDRMDKMFSSGKAGNGGAASDLAGMVPSFIDEDDGCGSHGLPLPPGAAATHTIVMRQAAEAERLASLRERETELDSAKHTITTSIKEFTTKKKERLKQALPERWRYTMYQTNFDGFETVVKQARKSFDEINATYEERKSVISKIREELCFTPYSLAADELSKIV